jgi:hypothetical protein
MKNPDNLSYPPGCVDFRSSALIAGGLSSLVTALSILASASAWAVPVNTTFQINQASSSLEATVQYSFFSDTDSKPLAGTISATLDFGETGGLPTLAEATVNSANVSAVGTYEFDLPRIFTQAHIEASGLRANVTTPAPPAPLTKPTVAATTYQFDASNFRLTMTQGVITVTGAFNETVDLATEDPPIAGTSPVGTIGTLALAQAGTSGFYTRFNATMNLPIFIDQTVMFGEPPNQTNVDLTIDATIVATTSFYVPLAGVPGDFDEDGDVDNADLTHPTLGFNARFGANLDGEDFLVWQRHFGTRPPLPIVSAIPAPELSAIGLMAMTALPLALHRRWR